MITQLTNAQIYRVGGFVRDTLLNLSPHDCDYVVVGVTAQAMLNAGFIQIGRYFPVFLHPETKEEYALARVERKIDQGHTGFKVFSDINVSLEDDLKRRDLTINAIAQDFDNNLIDPYHGIADINNKIIRHVSEAFVEDPLRILRAARFAAKLQFNIHPSTMNLMQDMAAKKLLAELSKERIYEEFEKAINNDNFGYYLLQLKQTNNLIMLSPELNEISTALFCSKLDKLNNLFDRYTLLFIQLTNIAEITNKNNLILHFKIIKKILVILNKFTQNNFIVYQELSSLQIHNNYAIIQQSLKSIGLLKPELHQISICTTNIIKQIKQHKFSFQENCTTTAKLDIINNYYSKTINTYLVEVL